MVFNYPVMLLQLYIMISGEGTLVMRGAGPIYFLYWFGHSVAYYICSPRNKSCGAKVLIIKRAQLVTG